MVRCWLAIPHALSEVLVGIQSPAADVSTARAWAILATCPVLTANGGGVGKQESSANLQLH